MNQTTNKPIEVNLFHLFCSPNLTLLRHPNRVHFSLFPFPLLPSTFTHSKPTNVQHIYANTQICPRITKNKGCVQVRQCVNAEVPLPNSRTRNKNSDGITHRHHTTPLHTKPNPTCPNTSTSTAKHPHQHLTHTPPVPYPSHTNHAHLHVTTATPTMSTLQ